MALRATASKSTPPAGAKQAALLRRVLEGGGDPAHRRVFIAAKKLSGMPRLPGRSKKTWTSSFPTSSRPSGRRRQQDLRPQAAARRFIKDGQENIVPAPILKLNPKTRPPSTGFSTVPGHPRARHCPSCSGSTASTTCPNRCSDARQTDMRKQRLRLATFYNAFGLAKGRHVIRVCMGTSCYVKGGVRISKHSSRNSALPSAKAPKT